ncbi:hypothetical protein B0H11DRAFT_2197322 [Mycena galericulata]|nr:hypothetical protein B0H11DRAFT_2197322 [Mycena galericulata]
MASKHSAADQAFLDGLPGWKLIEFRNYMFTPSYITSNAGRFLDHEWIDIPALREFLGNSAPEAGSDASSTRSTRLSACPDLVRIKTEGADPLPLSAPPTSFKIRTSYEGGREVLEISSDSESDADEISGDLTRGASRSSSVYHPPDDNELPDTPDSDDEFPTVVSAPSVELIESDDESHASKVSKNKDVNDFDCDSDADEHGGSNDSDDDSGLFESDTLWQDPIKSYVRIGNFQITKKNKSFKHIEYVDELPSVYPQFPERTAIVVDLRDPKFNIKKPNSDELYTVDHLIRNADNDSYRNDGSGAGSSTALVTFVPGEAAIECRRASGPGVYGVLPFGAPSARAGLRASRRRRMRLLPAARPPAPPAARPHRPVPARAARLPLRRAPSLGLLPVYSDISPLVAPLFYLPAHACAACPRSLALPTLPPAPPPPARVLLWTSTCTFLCQALIYDPSTPTAAAPQPPLRSVRAFRDRDHCACIYAPTPDSVPPPIFAAHYPPPAARRLPPAARLHRPLPAARPSLIFLQAFHIEIFFCTYCSPCFSIYLLLVFFF